MVSRVSRASVVVDGAVVGEVGRGLLALVGVARTDGEDAAREMARKIHELRIFAGADGEVSAADLGLPVLVVSQFTLQGDTRRGRRPSWSAAAPGPGAEGPGAVHHGWNAWRGTHHAGRGACLRGAGGSHRPRGRARART